MLKKRKKGGVEREKRGLNQKKKKKKKKKNKKKKKKKKTVLGWKKCFWAGKTFGLKKCILGWKIKGNTPKEKKERAGEKWGRLKQKNRSTETKTEKGVGAEAKKKKEEKKAETEKKKKGAALKLNKREGWNREFFSIYFLSNLLRKIMVISFMLDLILLVFRPLKTQLD